ncbi:MAG: hypothetical protein NC200_03680 [Candidatus Gastranaerophilales bacterium]|nr:hypothetical protein [Candidatus Gastranaerophilales bacterium]
MNTIDNNGLSFGIAFRPHTNNRGVRTAEMLDLHEEIKMYKSIADRLNTDVLEKTEKGVKSENFKLESEDSKVFKGMRYFGKEGEFFFLNDGTKLQNVHKHFDNARNLFDRFLNK